MREGIMQETRGVGSTVPPRLNLAGRRANVEQPIFVISLGLVILPHFCFESVCS